MKDPRLAEIEFLASLEKNGTLAIQFSDDITADEHLHRMLVFELLDQLCIAEPFAYRGSPGLSEVGSKRLRAFAYEAQLDLFRSTEIRVQITHRGRVRLWQLRDELLRNPDREPFGILLNRQAWDRALPTELQFASKDRPVAVMLADLDHFKSVNDTHGHSAGDEVLKAAFAIISAAVSGASNAYRYGGEEIGVILPNADENYMKRVAEEILVGIQTHVNKRAKMPDDWRPQTISIGGAVFTEPHDAKTAADIVDKRLYSAKESGRNQLVCA